jgi:alpha-1,3-glucan synthase
MYRFGIVIMPTEADKHSMGDLIGFDGFLNETAPFRPEEHKVQWKSSRQYTDFSFGNNYKDTCEYPKFWNESGLPVLKDSNEVFAKLVGCYDSEFDQVSSALFTRRLSC